MKIGYINLVRESSEFPFCLETVKMNIWSIYNPKRRTKNTNKNENIRERKKSAANDPKYKERNTHINGSRPKNESEMNSFENKQQQQQTGKVLVEALEITATF